MRGSDVGDGQGLSGTPPGPRVLHLLTLGRAGNIVDPTVHQFPSRGAGDYRELGPDEKVPTNRCANCGGDVFNGDTVCSPACYSAYAAYLNIPRNG